MQSCTRHKQICIHKHTKNQSWQLPKPWNHSNVAPKETNIFILITYPQEYSFLNLKLSFTPVHAAQIFAMCSSCAYQTDYREVKNAELRYFNITQRGKLNIFQEPTEVLTSIGAVFEKWLFLSWHSMVQPAVCILINLEI